MTEFWELKPCNDYGENIHSILSHLLINNWLYNQIVNNSTKNVIRVKHLLIMFASLLKKTYFHEKLLCNLVDAPLSKLSQL